MKLIISPAAAKALGRMPRKDAQSLLAKLKQVAEAPAALYPWATRLADHPGFRVRHGDWRAIYRLDWDRGEMIVVKVAKRGEVYR